MFFSLCICTIFYTLQFFVYLYFYPVISILFVLGCFWLFGWLALLGRLVFLPDGILNIVLQSARPRTPPHRMSPRRETHSAPASRTSQLSTNIWHATTTTASPTSSRTTYYNTHSPIHHSTSPPFPYPLSMETLYTFPPYKPNK